MKDKRGKGKSQGGRAEREGKRATSTSWGDSPFTPSRAKTSGLKDKARKQVRVRVIIKFLHQLFALALRVSFVFSCWGITIVVFPTSIKWQPSRHPLYPWYPSARSTPLEKDRWKLPMPKPFPVLVLVVALKVELELKITALK